MGTNYPNNPEWSSSSGPYQSQPYNPEGYVPNPYQQPANPYQQQNIPYAPQGQVMYPVAPPQESGKAVGALILGICSIVFPVFPGIILSIIGIIVANQAIQQTPANSGMANAGRICSIIGLVISGIAGICLIFYVIAIITALSSAPTY
jgi:hypothetical protein